MDDAFELTLTRPEGRPVTLRREGSALTEDGRREDLGEVDLAKIRFEWRVDELRAQGATIAGDTVSEARIVEGAGGVSFALARFLADKDPQAAELVEAEAMRWHFDDAATRAREASLLREFAPHGARHRSQFFLAEHTDGVPRVIDDGTVAWAWLYDDDIVSLADGYLRDSVLSAVLGEDVTLNPWRVNLTARHALRGLLEDPRASRLGALFVLLFGDPANIETPLREALGDASLVTHLTLRTQQKDVDVSRLGRRFPRLRALHGDIEQLPHALDGGAPELESLVVHAGGSRVDRVLKLIERGDFPRLRHLGLPYSRVGGDAIEALARSEVVARLQTLDLFTVNDATGFDFDALRRHRERFEHLKRVAVPAHGVWGREKDFADWPAVTFANHDRRELLAMDLETTGWARDMR